MTIRDRITRVRARTPGVEDYPASMAVHRRLILLSQKVARFEFENQLFEKIQGLAGRC
jgi:hypothetical protein